MADQWGLCKSCKWWQIEPSAESEDATMGICIDEKIQPYRLLVSGHSGCNRFMKGAPAREEGSSSRPPTASPTR